MTDWNADVYHRVSDPQLAWGLPVLERLRLEGDEVVLDIGCGTGRLTERLLDRLANGRVVAVDRSENMLAAARVHLRARHGDRVRFTRADAAALPFSDVADAIFSTATFHWVPDHERLFDSLYGALRPGGRLVAQCGGGPNLRRIHERCRILMGDQAFAPYFREWTEPWEFADADTTAWRLRRAGFTDVRTTVVSSPVEQPDAGAYSEFVEHVVCRPYLACLARPAARARFLGALVEAAGRDTPPFVLDYWRLNMDARRPHRRRVRSSSS